MGRRVHAVVRRPCPANMCGELFLRSRTKYAHLTLSTQTRHLKFVAQSTL